MSQSRRKRTGTTSVARVPDAKAINRDRQRKWTGYILAAVVIAIITVIIGGFYYQNNVAPFRRTVITVDDVSLRMDYFLMRTRLAGVAPMTMLGTLTDEQLIKLAAPRYGIEVSAEDINQTLRRMFQGQSENISESKFFESEFKEWYRQRLNESGLSDAEYQEIVATNLVAARLQEYLGARMPTIAEQVHLQAILVETLREAEKVRARWEKGENFAALAREVSLDEPSRENGGDLGWLARGIMGAGFEDVAFNLGIGEVSEPLPSGEGYYLLMVSEKAAARELDEDSRQRLRAKVVGVWLAEERKLHEIKWHGLKNGFDSETNAWINWQLAKSKPSSTSQGQSQP